MPDLKYVSGLSALDRKLKELPKKISSRVLRKSVLAGAGLIKRATSKRVPVGKKARRRGGRVVQPGVMRKALVNKFAKELSNDTQAAYVVTFRRGKKQQEQGRDAYYAPWVERGHKIVPRKSSKQGGLLLRTLVARRLSANRFVRPYPSLGPAFEASKEQALQAMVKRMEAELKKVIG